MDQNESRLTVLFQPPFWVGIAERWTADGYEAARAVFGAEPTDAALFQWVLAQWGHLQFSPAEPEDGPRPVNASRARREARAALANAGIGTKAQQALNQQREQESTQSQQRRKQRRQEQDERCYLLRQQKSAKKSGADSVP